MDVDSNLINHSIDLYTHIFLFEKATPVMKLRHFWLRKKSIVITVINVICSMNIYNSAFECYYDY